MHRTLPSPAKVQHAAEVAAQEDQALDRLHRTQPEPSRADIAIAACRARHTVHGCTSYPPLCDTYEALIRRLCAELEGPAPELFPGTLVALGGLGVRK